MIVFHRQGSLCVVTQADHARFSGQLLALWRRDALPEHPRRGDLLFAVSEHDNGWREADAAPRVDPESGRPYDFLALPDAPRLELWRRGIERYAADRPYVALLILEHALRLHRDRRGRAPWEAWLEALEERRAELLAAWGGGEEELASDYRWLALADSLSLLACSAVAGGRLDPAYSASHEGDRLLLDPFPLAGATRFDIPARRVPAEAYRGDADFAVRLAAARWESLPVRVTPTGSAG